MLLGVCWESLYLRLDSAWREKKSGPSLVLQAQVLHSQISMVVMGADEETPVIPKGSTPCFGRAQDWELHFTALSVGVSWSFVQSHILVTPKLVLKSNFFQNSVPIIPSSSGKCICDTSQSCCQTAQPPSKPRGNNKECRMCFLKRQVKFVYERSNPGTSPGSLHTVRLVLFFALQFHSFKSFQVIPIPALKGWNSL